MDPTAWQVKEKTVMTRFARLYCFAFLILFLLSACSQPAIRITNTAISPTVVPKSTLTATPVPTSTTASTSTATPTITPVPPGVFALQVYSPLVMTYNPALWEDETDYARHDTSERYPTNSLQSKKLKSCQIAIGLPVEFNRPEPWQMVRLGNVKYAMLPFEDPATGAIYMENDSLPGFNYEIGRPVPVISSNASEWSQCKVLGEDVLSTLHVPSPALTSTPEPTIAPTPTPTTAPVPSFSLTTPGGLLVEEYALKGPGQGDTRNFDPVQSSQAAILDKHWIARHDHFHPESEYNENGLSVTASTGKSPYIAKLFYTSTEGGYAKATVEVWKEDQRIYSAPAGELSPLNVIEGLWVYGDHWVLEYAYVTNTRPNPGEVDSAAEGQIVLDGVLLNQTKGWQEGFGFQLIQGQPFYFFQKDGKIGVSYAGETLPLEYNEIPHYGCCSAAAVNPDQNQTMVDFFARRGETWYYVEMGNYESTSVAQVSATLPPPAATVAPAIQEPPTPTPIPASWKTFSAPDLHLQFRYPAEWQAESARRLSGADGFVELSLQDDPASLFDVTQSTCVVVANTDAQAVYGPTPQIATWASWDPDHQIWAGSGCIVMPSGGPASTAQERAVLYTRYPAPLLPDQLLVLRADAAHFSGILSTLRFLDYAPTTPSSGYYNSPDCQKAPEGQKAALQTETLVITETAITNTKCDPWLQFDGFQLLAAGVEAQIERSTTWQDGLQAQAAEDNLALRRFGYQLVEHASSSPLSFDLYHDNTLILSDLTRLSPVSVNLAGDDFILWIQDSFHNDPAVEVRSGGARSLTVWDNGFNTAWVGADRIGYEYAGVPITAGGPPSQVNITRNGQIVDRLAIDPPGATGYPVTGFWSWDGHWLLEMDSVVVQDGKLLNQSLGYEEVFHWRLMGGEPFYFFQKGAGFGLNYAGQELPLRYDDIIHGQLCCDPAHYSILSTPSEAWFYARKGNHWYLVQVQTKLSN